jgi:hypothetical protein
MAGGQRQHGVDGLDLGRPGDLGVAVDILHHHRRGALVLAGHLGVRREELDAIALDRAAIRNIGLQRRLAERLGIIAAMVPELALPLLHFHRSLIHG